MNINNLEKLIQLGNAYEELYFNPGHKDQALTDTYHDLMSDHLTEIVENFEDPETAHLIEDTPDYILSQLLSLSLICATFPERNQQHTTVPLNILMKTISSDTITYFLSYFYSFVDFDAEMLFLEKLSTRSDHWKDMPLSWLKEMYPPVELPLFIPNEEQKKRIAEKLARPRS